MARRPRKPPPAADPFDPFAGPVDETIDLHGFTALEARERQAKQTPLSYFESHAGAGRYNLAAGIHRPAQRN